MNAQQPTREVLDDAKAELLYLAKRFREKIEVVFADYKNNIPPSKSSDAIDTVLQALASAEQRLQALMTLHPGHDVFIDRDPDSVTVRFWPRQGPGPEYTHCTLEGAIDAAQLSQSKN